MLLESVRIRLNSVGRSVGRNEKRLERGVFIDSLAEAVSAINIFQPM